MFRKKSLKFKLSLILFCMILFISVLSILLNQLFLTKYYTYNKKQSLINAYEKICSISSEADAHYPYDGSALKRGAISEDGVLKIEKLSLEQNLSVIIYRDMYTDIFSIPFGTKSKMLIYSSLGSSADSKVESSNIYADYVNGLSDTDDISFRQEDSYAISRIDVKRLGSSYLYLEGLLDNGDHILIRASVAGITEGVVWANRFFIYIALVVGLLGILIMGFVVDRFLRPVQSLTNIAMQMSNLDFANRYEVVSDDEIGNLGKSINSLSDNLEQALRELNEANKALKEELDKRVQIDEMRKEFLSNVSHELKTPIALIQGYAEGLSDNIFDDEESRQFYCEVIVDEAKKMNQMVKKIIELNKLEFGYSDVDLETFDIVAMITQIIDKTDILIKQQDIDLKLDLPKEMPVLSDSLMTEEVFSNYLSNAIHHAEGEKKITVMVKPEDSHVRICVHNTGKQIPEGEIERIWEKFYKIDKSRSREYGGTGIGLSIVKASMERLGQAYGCENTEDGVMFWFELLPGKNKKDA